MPVVTPRFDLDPDTTLGGANASDEVGATQKAVKDYVDNHGGGSSYTAGTGIDITNDVISVASPTLTNTATGYSSLSILGNASASSNAINIGIASGSNNINATAVGYQTSANGDKSLALGFNASASGTSSIQLGSGLNYESNSFYVSTANDSTKNWKMLGNDGLIPDARISSNIARTSAIPSVDQTYDGTSQNAQSGTAVAEAIAAADLNGKADVDLSNLNSTGQKVLDGQWVHSTLTIANSVSAPTSTNLEYDLSTYLPNDGYNYEVLISGTGVSGSTSGNRQRIQVTSQILTANTYLWDIIARTTNTVVGGGNCIIPIGSNRKIYVTAYVNNTNVFSLFARGYRRIGTNQ